MKRLSLSGRITWLLGLAAVVILGAAAFTMDHLVDAEMGQRMDDAVLAQARMLASLVNAGPEGLDMDVVKQPRRQLLASRAADFWSVHCADGSTTTSRPPPPDYPVHWLRDAHEQPTFANVSAASGTLRAVWFRFQTDAGGRSETASNATLACSVVYLHSRSELDEILNTIDDILLLTPLLALLAVLLLSPMLVRRGLKPLAALGEAMQDIGPQSPGQRLPATGTRELEPLAVRFNEVLERMDEGVTRERQFAGALAHETRTHLAELRALLDDPGEAEALTRAYLDRPAS